MEGLLLAVLAAFAAGFALAALLAASRAREEAGRAAERSGEALKMLQYIEGRVKYVEAVVEELKRHAADADYRLRSIFESTLVLRDNLKTVAASAEAARDHSLACLQALASRRRGRQQQAQQ